MFTVQRHTGLRDRLLDHAQKQPEVIAAAEVGSGARGDSDQWSDIDIALRLSPGSDVTTTAQRWTSWLAEVDEVCDTMDVHAFGATYRVFLMRDSLQVDLSFFPHDRFRATDGEPMMLHFGKALPAAPGTPPDWHGTAQRGWLYLLHARSAVARERVWQAELMLSETRAVVLALAAQRPGFRADHGRQAHLLPVEVTSPLAQSRAASLDVAELTRSLGETVECYLHEVKHQDVPLHDSLAPALNSPRVP